MRNLNGSLDDPRLRYLHYDLNRVVHDTLLLVNLRNVDNLFLLMWDVDIDRLLDVEVVRAFLGRDLRYVNFSCLDHRHMNFDHVLCWHMNNLLHWDVDVHLHVHMEVMSALLLLDHWHVDNLLLLMGDVDIDDLLDMHMVSALLLLDCRYVHVHLPRHGNWYVHNLFDHLLCNAFLLMNHRNVHKFLLVDGHVDVHNFLHMHVMCAFMLCNHWHVNVNLPRHRDWYI